MFQKIQYLILVSTLNPSAFQCEYDESIFCESQFEAKLQARLVCIFDKLRFVHCKKNDLVFFMLSLKKSMLNVTYLSFLNLS